VKYPIIVGTDLTEASDDALIQAETRAARDDAPLTVVHATSPLLWGPVLDAEYTVRLETLIRQQNSALTGRSVLHSIDTGFIQTLAADVINGGAYAARPLGQRSLFVDARQALRAELRRRQVEADICVVEGRAPSIIPQMANRIDAELVIVGTAHRPAPTSSVTTAVLRHAPCSVLVVDDGAALVLTDSVARI
jgi:nucleotide-binding universal stress UspA family protein